MKNNIENYIATTLSIAIRIASFIVKVFDINATIMQIAAIIIKIRAMII